MANSHTRAESRRATGLTKVDHVETDSPLLPAEQIIRMQAIRPDAVDLILTETKLEADHRRRTTVRVNTFVFIERLAGQVFALLIGLSGILGGAYTATHGAPEAGAAISCVSIGTLAVAFIVGRAAKTAKKD